MSAPLTVFAFVLVVAGAPAAGAACFAAAVSIEVARLVRAAAE